MAILLKIKNVKAAKELFPVVDGKKLTTSFGMKVYSAKELPEIKEKFRKLAINDQLEMAQAQLEKFETAEDKSEETYYSTREAMRSKIAALRDKQEADSIAFYKQQIIFIKNATFAVQNDDGTVSDLVILNTEEVKPIESLWSSSEECLAVLLDVFFDNNSIRDSLITLITDFIFDLNLAEKIKN